jgi:hypothetical protein
MPTAIATLFKNANATDVASVNVWLEANFASTSLDS